jgi:hypothetical protein
MLKAQQAFLLTVFKSHRVISGRGQICFRASESYLPQKLAPRLSIYDQPRRIPLIRGHTV